MMEIHPVKTTNFYSKDIQKFAMETMERSLRNASRYKHLWKRMPQRLMGPTQYWEQFPRQADAIEAAVRQSKMETVCVFVYQKEDGFREFIVAHPEVFWWYISQRPSERRCAYELIADGAPCWLYFDLEFKLALNPDRNGPRMTETVMKIFSSYIQKYYGLMWDERNVVNLDSTTSKKFSRHLIFCKKDIAFRDNFHVRRLVKGVCREIEEYLENSSVLHDVLSLYSRQELEELFVETDKGRKIFIDTSVYSRNRHFRIFKSTKWGKLSHLEIAPESKHVPLQHRDDPELAVFLDSLVSYFPNKRDLLLLEIKDGDSLDVKSYAKLPHPYNHATRHSNVSPYPVLDKFILSLVKPGKIRMCKFYYNRKMITYEIFGNRYCANIGRQHKSNNVFWNADLSTKKVYQRCHDEDCADFSSAAIDIPLEVAFQLDNKDDQLFLDIPELEESKGDDTRDT